MFTINTNTSTPIYQQLIDQIRVKIGAQQLKPGDALPSVREIATALAINPMTVSKAFSSLESQWVLVRQRGKPMQVADGLAPAAVTSPLQIIDKDIESLAAKARQLNIDAKTLISALTKHMENCND